MTPQALPRVSAVSYLNTCPLVWGLLHGPQQGVFDLKFELPSACAASLGVGAADVGLVPVIEMFRQKLEPASNVCIASDGPVRSIFLIFRRPLRAIRSIALDSSSRTSVALTKIVLAERYGIQPLETELAPDLERMLVAADAALVIGDPALRIDPNSAQYEILDLGAEWQSLTGLPMVYAVWAGRPGNIPPRASELFHESYLYGSARIEEIVEHEAPPRGVSEGLATTYLTEHIRYDLSARALRGLNEFKRLAGCHNLL